MLLEFLRAAVQQSGMLSLTRSESAALPLLHYIVGRPETNGKGRQGGIKTAVGHIDAGIGDKQVVDLMRLACAIHDGSLRICSHPAGACLMHSPAKSWTGS